MKLTVFGFHGIVAEPFEVHDSCFVEETTFRQQLLAIRDRHEVVPLRAGIEALREAGHEQEGGAGRPLAALTFDDAFQSTCTLALPLLAELGLPASCFLTTNAVETGRPLWFCRVHRAISRTGRPCLAWAGRSWPLTTPAEREAASAAVETLMKDVPGEYVDDEVDRLSRLLEVNPDEPLDDSSPYRPLDAESIRTMVRSGLVEFGGHGHRHMILTSIDPAAQRDEIVTSVEAVRDLTGQAADSFAYPNGQEDDYDEATIADLRDVGVTAALTTMHGSCTPTSPAWALPRVMLGGRSWKAQVA